MTKELEENSVDSEEVVSDSQTTDNSEVNRVLEKPNFTVRQLLEAGVHFGHKTMRWNPKMSQYIYGSRDRLHIIDLNKTSVLLYKAANKVREVARKNGRILFVATKKQATETVAETAKRCGQYYVNCRWLGGMLTNWKTISKSLKTLKDLENQLANEESVFDKKEKLMLTRDKDKLERNLGGIRTMGGYPDLMIVIDIRKEKIAVLEAKALGIPVMAVIDTNVDPDCIDYPIPGNDDSIKAIKLYCRVLSDAILEGIEKSMTESGVMFDKPKREIKKQVFVKKPGKMEEVVTKGLVEKKVEVKKEPEKKKEEVKSVNVKKVEEEPKKEVEKTEVKNVEEEPKKEVEKTEVKKSVEKETSTIKKPVIKKPVTKKITKK